MNSMFRFVLWALLGGLLTTFAVLHELTVHPGAPLFHRLAETSPVLRAVLSFPPGIVVATAGLVILAVAIYRVRILWNMRRAGSPRGVFTMPPSERNPRRMAVPKHAIEQDVDGDEYGPIDSFSAALHDRRRGNGQFDSQRAESYR